MGLDGGTTPSRSDILRRSSWQLARSDQSTSSRGGTVSRAAHAATAATSIDRSRAALTHCALTNEQLRGRIVACGLGRLYKRDSVVEWLAGETSGRFDARLRARLQRSGAFAHLTSLRDVFELHLPWEAGDVQFVCTVTGHTADGAAHVFVALRRCGHAFCSHALTAAPELFAQQRCPVCNVAFAQESDVVRIADFSEEGQQHNAATLARRKHKPPAQPATAAAHDVRVSLDRDCACGGRWNLTTTTPHHQGKRKASETETQDEQGPARTRQRVTRSDGDGK